MSFLFRPQPLSPAKQRQRNVQKKCAARAKLFFFFFAGERFFDKFPTTETDMTNACEGSLHDWN